MSINEITREEIINETCGALRKRLEQSNMRTLPEKGLYNEMTLKSLDIVREFEKHIRMQIIGIF